MKQILPPRLHPGDTIGIASPSHIVKPGSEERTVRVLQKLGFRVKFVRRGCKQKA